ncbi:N-6 DNA methylase [Mucilaginibacter sp. UC70_90]
MQQLTRLFRQLSYQLSERRAFDLILDSLLYPVCIQAHEDYSISNPVENYKISASEITILKQVLIRIGDIAETGHDPLGDLFMEFISGGHNGQYFTPMELCKFIAAISIGLRESEDNARMHDPACGSGRMFLAAAQSDKKLHFFGTDIDMICCRMAAANMILHNLVADISCGDTLTMRYSHVYMIRRSPFNNFPVLRILKYVRTEDREWQRHRQH